MARSRGQTWSATVQGRALCCCGLCHGSGHAGVAGRCGRHRCADHPGTLAGRSAGGYLLMGIFIHLVIVLPLMLMLARPDASIFGTRVLLCVAACAAMTALYWFAGLARPRVAGAGWPAILLLLLLTLGNVATSGRRASCALHPPPPPKSKRAQLRNRAQRAFRARYSGVRPSWAHRGGLGMVAGFTAIVFVGTSEVDIVCW